MNKSDKNTCRICDRHKPGAPFKIRDDRGVLFTTSFISHCPYCGRFLSENYKKVKEMKKGVDDSMGKIALIFTECEHEGDIEQYQKDIQECLNKSGGEISGTNINPAAELGRVVITFDNEEQKQNFWTLFKETDAYGFLN